MQCKEKQKRFLVYRCSAPSALPGLGGGQNCSEGEWDDIIVTLTAYAQDRRAQEPGLLDTYKLTPQPLEGG